MTAVVDGPAVSRTLARLFDDAVESHGTRPAVRIDDRQLTYAELAEQVYHGAARLHHHGVGRGSRLALCAANSVEFVVAVLAATRLGATVILVSTSWRDAEVSHAAALTEPTHVVHDGSGVAAIESLLPGVPTISTKGLGEPTQLAVPPAAGELDDVAVMVFSSGTTGLPKAVCHSHRTMGAATRHWVQCLGMSAEDRLQIATPPFHILGLLNLLAVISAGASVRLHRRFDLDALLGAIERDRVTIEMVVAPIALAMAAHPRLEDLDLGSLRYIMWGATPITASVAETVTARCGARFLAAYGASEFPVIAVNPQDRPDEWRLDSVGLPPRGVALRVVGLADGAVLGTGQTGELQVSGPSMMLGYLPATATAEAIDGRWYRTGDVGHLDSKGWVYITDRVKEMIKVRGFQVAPAEVEGVLLGHPGVADCAVFGMPDPPSDEAVVAAVVRAAGSEVSAEQLRQLVAASLASYKQLREVRFVAQIPRLPSGKVLRRELQAAGTDERTPDGRPTFT